jgi:hypothetical protein
LLNAISVEGDAERASLRLREGANPRLHVVNSLLETIRGKFMKTASTRTASILLRFAGVTSPLLAGALFLGCAVGSQGDPGGERVGEAVAALSGWWSPASVVSTTNTTPTNTEAAISDWTCVLSAVGGSLNAGENASFDGPGAFMSEVFISALAPSFTEWGLQVNGGAYNNPATDEGEWAGNTVLGATTCFPEPYSAMGTWQSVPEGSPITPPLKISDIQTDPQRYCFLSGIILGDTQSDSSSSDVLVHPVTTAGGKYPTTGWYVESNSSDTANDSVAEVQATCIDFPSLAGVWAGVSTAGTYTLTTGTGIKACGISEIWGPLNASSTSDGVIITPPSVANGNWTLKVSAGLTAGWICVQ